MDFVVVGLGLGALAVLVGLALRDFGPRFRRFPLHPRVSRSQVRDAISWGRACRAGGLVLALAGGGLSLLTLVALFSRASDRSGGLIVACSGVVALCGIAAWAYVFRRRMTLLEMALGDSPNALNESLVPNGTWLDEWPLAETPGTGVLSIARRWDGNEELDAHVELPVTAESGDDDRASTAREQDQRETWGLWPTQPAEANLNSPVLDRASSGGAGATAPTRRA
ncbi:MAG: hypothetical protein H0T49_04990 [Chloroflexia bacterium]|nr:hypothetical protein [Chloroflexia bacterium]